MRDYGESNQIGLEESPQAYIEKIVIVFREVWRVLKTQGTLWLILGDTYSGSSQIGRRDKQFGGGLYEGKQRGWLSEMTRTQKRLCGLKPKDLMMIPHKVAIALQEDGWWVRQDIVWAKNNPMPEPAKDRCVRSHEYIFLLTKSKNYFFDYEAIQEPVASERMKSVAFESRNKRSVWAVSVKPYPEAHFAVFPPELIEPCILAGCPKGGTVLDPFGGSGTTAGVALKHGRKAIVCELNPEYVDLMPKRIEMISGRSKEQRTLFDW